MSIVPEDFGEAFLHGATEQIYKQCTKEFQELVSFEEFENLAQSFNENVESYKLSGTTALGLISQYLWLDYRQEKAVCVAFDSANTIHRILLKPYITFPKSDDRYTKNYYSMPILDEWIVFWGGTNEFLNYHYLYDTQRYAYDLVKLVEGRSYKDNPMRNEHYYAFNQKVLAPADGKGVKVVNDLADNVPGEMDETRPAGNYLVLAHGHNEYSLLAHFKQHSIAVHEGELVKQGQFVGLCGNTGNSSEPHIHFQVMDSPDFMNCRSIRIRFTNGEQPIQGDTVRQSSKPKKQKMDTFDKVDAAFTLADVFLFIPRIIGSFFK